MIETFEFCDRNSCLHYGSKDILIKDVRIVWQTKDIIIYGATSSTANIKGIGKTVTLAQALFSLLGYTFFDDSELETKWAVRKRLPSAKPRSLF